MEGMKTNNFLMLNSHHLRNIISGVDESYNNPWDILAELTQNALDAIRKAGKDKGLIQLEINAQERTFSIRDNGTGIEPDLLTDSLNPFSTSKKYDESAIGEKGVGLTFALFSCNFFYLKTGNGGSSLFAKVIGAYNWKNSTEEDIPFCDTGILDEPFEGTEIILRDVQKCPIFHLTFEQLVYILRTKTSVGNTKPIWGEVENLDISLRFVDQNGGVHQMDVPFKYWLAFDEMPSNSKISLKEFEDFLKSKVDISDLEKRNMLRGKILYDIGEFKLSNQRKLRYVACFVPTRQTWNTVSRHFGLCTEEDLKKEEWLDNFSYAKFEPGIFTSVKGMPTGISITPPSTGYNGYWPSFFMLFEDPCMKFDIGRKSIDSEMVKPYRKKARELFNRFIPIISKHISNEDTTITTSLWERDEVFAELEEMLDLEVEGIKFQKNPKDQEASVVALFFECIGNGKIKDIRPLQLGYRNKYDLYAHWNKKRVVIEFKSRLRNIVKDFSDMKKMFNEMDCIVCWEITSDDLQMLKKKGLEVEEIKPSILYHDQYQFPNATHKLIFNGFIKPVFIIDMKKILLV